MVIRAIRLIAATAVLLAISQANAADKARADAATDPSIVQGITLPSARHNPHFGTPGILRLMSVHPGDVVKKAQLLAQEDSSVEALEVAALKIEADSVQQIEAAKTESQSKKVQRDNLKAAYDKHASSFSEYEQARLDYELALIKIQLATEEHLQKQAEVQKEAAKLQQMSLYSPADGIVERVNLQEGDVVDPNKPEGAISIVVNSPLWVEMHLQSAQAAKLQLGQALAVGYSGETTADLKASVIYLDPVVDAASDTQTVRLALDNPQQRPAGLLVNVHLAAIK